MNRYAIQMQHKDMTTIYINVVEYEDSLQRMYELCDCDTIDIISLRHHIPEYQKWFNRCVKDNESVDIVCDDNGKLFRKPPTLPLFYNHEVYDIVSGDIIFIIGNNETGETYGFTDEQTTNVLVAINDYIDTFKSKLTYYYLNDDRPKDPPRTNGSIS